METVIVAYLWREMRMPRGSFGILEGLERTRQASEYRCCIQVVLFGLDSWVGFLDFVSDLGLDSVKMDLRLVLLEAVDIEVASGREVVEWDMLEAVPYSVVLSVRDESVALSVTAGLGKLKSFPFTTRRRTAHSTSPCREGYVGEWWR